MYTSEEIEEICTILDGVIEHVESYYECDEVGPSMSYEYDNSTFDIDYTCWNKEESLSSITTIYPMIDESGKRTFVLNVVESGYSMQNGDFENEETLRYPTLEELTKKLFDLFGF